ncbi:MAG: hypothetical protein KAT00_00210 [Planctomycetes bacterium]|nr:hypothetical protein [Planctomycetota bacterium]
MKNLFNAALLLRDDVTTVEVQFDGSRDCYTFIVTRAMAKGIEKGDQLIVESKRGGQGAIAQVRVVRLHKEPKIDLNVDYTYAVVMAHINREERAALIQSTSLMADQIRVRQAASTREQLMSTLGLDVDTVKALQSASIDDMFDEEDL